MPIPSDYLAMSTKDGLYWPFGLDIFEGRLVLSILVLAALMQALAVGRPIGLSWAKAFGFSFTLNTIWFVVLFGFCFPFRFGGQATPNPTLFAIEQLAHLALTTTLLLGPLWHLAAGRVPSLLSVFGRIAITQALWIPASLLILMAPSEPLRHLETVETNGRNIRLRGATYDLKDGLPKFSSPAEFAQAFDLPDKVIRLPRFPRWATHDHGPVVLEVNTALSGRKFGGESRVVWLWRYPYVFPTGKVEVHEGTIDISTGKLWVNRPD